MFKTVKKHLQRDKEDKMYYHSKNQSQKDQGEKKRIESFRPKQMKKNESTELGLQLKQKEKIQS